MQIDKGEYDVGNADEEFDFGMQVLKHGIIWLFLFWVLGAIHGDEAPPPVGNFSLPSSQQIGTLVSFGDFLVDEGQSQVYLYADNGLGRCLSLVDLEPYFVYGITDNVAVLAVIPFAIYRQGDSRASGFEDINIQAEYAFYNKSTARHIDQATVVANVSFPTGSAEKQPSTGAGSPGYFLGLTCNRTTVEWFFFSNLGGVVYPSLNADRTGGQLLYQFGFARLLSDWKGWISALLFEFDGTYSQKNTSEGVFDPNSGGQALVLTPSLWLSSERAILQVGAGFPLLEDLNGIQKRQNVTLVGSFGWTF